MKYLLSGLFALFVALSGLTVTTTGASAEKRYRIPLTSQEWMWVLASRKAFQQKYGYYPRRGRALSSGELAAVILSRSKGDGVRSNSVAVPVPPGNGTPPKLPEGIGAVPGICLYADGAGINPPEPPIVEPEPPIDPCEECASIQPLPEAGIMRRR